MSLFLFLFFPLAFTLPFVIYVLLYAFVFKPGFLRVIFISVFVFWGCICLVFVCVHVSGKFTKKKKKKKERGFLHRSCVVVDTAHWTGMRECLQQRRESLNCVRSFARQRCTVIALTRVGCMLRRSLLLGL